MYRNYVDGLKNSLTEDLRLKCVNHRNRFIKMFMARYTELLPSLIVYDGIENTSINQLKLEHGLRNNINVVVGQATNGKILIMGFINRDNRSYENPTDFLTTDIITKDDIHFIIPNHLIPNVMKEISYYDDCKSGNFIVLKNKAISLVSDMLILQHYTIELAELVASRFSITMQSKVHTFLYGSNNDETISEIASQLYNGSPYIKVSKLFEPTENIVTINNTGLASMFSELKREYQNKIAELNNMLGINSLAVEKESGVSDNEAKSNKGFTTSNANIYISSRQNEIDKLNKRYNLDIIVKYNDEVKSTLLNLEGEDYEEHDAI